jgi:hypothetical protein
MVCVLLLPWDFVACAKTTISQEEDFFNHSLKPFLDKSEVMYYLFVLVANVQRASLAIRPKEVDCSDRRLVFRVFL